MALLLERQWARQPTGPALINAAHPLAYRWAFLHSFGSLVDVSGNGYHVTPGSAGGLGPAGLPERSFLGQAYLGNGASTGAGNISKVVSFASGEQITALALFRVLGSDTTGGVLTLRETAVGPPILGLCVGASGLATVSGAALFVCRDDANSLCGTTTGPTVNDGRWHLMATRRAAGRWQYSVDGSEFADFQTSPTNGQGSMTFGPTPAINYAHESVNAGIGALNCEILLGGICRSAFTNQQIRSIWDNPWQLFAPQRVVIPLSVASGLPVLSAATVTNLASTSARPRVTITI